MANESEGGELLHSCPAKCRCLLLSITGNVEERAKVPDSAASKNWQISRVQIVEFRVTRIADKKEGKDCYACFQPKMTKAELLFCSFPKSKLCFFFFFEESVERMRSSPSKVVRFFPIKIKQNWQQAVPKPDATREKGKWLQTKLPTQKSPTPNNPLLLSAPAI